MAVNSPMWPLAILLAAFAGGQLEPQPINAWMQCLADQAVVTARSNESAEVAADAAMGGCSEAEGRLVEVERRSVTNSGLEALERAQERGRAVIRQRVIARIVSLRSAS